MEKDSNTEQKYIQARKKVKNLKIFYIHLIGYIILVVLLCYNLWIIEGPYKDFFTWFNTIMMISWTVFIGLHALHVFKGITFFSSSWEKKKLKEFMNEENKTNKWE